MWPMRSPSTITEKKLKTYHIKPWAYCGNQHFLIGMSHQWRFLQIGNFTHQNIAKITPDTLTVPTLSIEATKSSSITIYNITPELASTRWQEIIWQMNAPLDAATKNGSIAWSRLTRRWKQKTSDTTMNIMVFSMFHTSWCYLPDFPCHSLVKVRVKVCTLPPLSEIRFKDFWLI